MSESRAVGVLGAALTVVLVGLVAGNVLWRMRERRTGEAAARVPPAAAPVADAQANSVDPAGVASAVNREDTRRDTWERLRLRSAGTYLPDMIAEYDSAIRHWPPHRERALRVAILRSGAQGYVEEFNASARWAVGRWNGIGLPVFLVTSADTVDADIVMTWVDSLSENRTGRADVTWNDRGEIVQARVVLATHLPDGSPVTPREMSAIALHEFGHALGLGHSPDSTDALHRATAATDVTPRDRRTALLLYDLPMGSLKN